MKLKCLQLAPDQHLPRTSLGRQIVILWWRKGSLNRKFRLQNMSGMTTWRNKFFITQQSETFLGLRFRSLIYKSPGLWAFIMARNSSAFRTWACLPPAFVKFDLIPDEKGEVYAVLFTSQTVRCFFRRFDGTWVLSICVNSVIASRPATLALICLLVCVRCVTNSHKIIGIQVIINSPLLTAFIVKWTQLFVASSWASMTEFWENLHIKQIIVTIKPNIKNRGRIETWECWHLNPVFIDFFQDYTNPHKRVFLEVFSVNYADKAFNGINSYRRLWAE